MHIFISRLSHILLDARCFDKLFINHKNGILQLKAIKYRSSNFVAFDDKKHKKDSPDTQI